MGEANVQHALEKLVRTIDANRIPYPIVGATAAPQRLIDLANVLEFMRVLKLPAKPAADLNPYVREKYLEIWQAAQNQDGEPRFPVTNCRSARNASSISA
jgi:hypothetical protein